MFDGMSFDEVNKLNDTKKKRISIPYEEYFEEMDLTEEQINERIRSAEELEDVFIGLLALVFYLMQGNAFDYTYAVDQTQDQYMSIAERTEGLSVSEYYRDVHISSTIMNVIGTTINNPNNPFNFSIDRAMLIAENESNSMWNDSDFEEAKRSGKTHKTWRSIIDKRTRDSHRYLDGKTIRIMEPFEVGEYLMMYPKDESMGAGMEEISNCRCSVEYSGNNRFDISDNDDIMNTITDVASYVGQPIEKTDNQSIREWYVANVISISSLIDRTKSIEEQAREAYSLRNQFKREARVAMSDRETADALERLRPVKSFDELLNDKMRRKGLTREQAIKDILDTATKTNMDVNKEFGITGV